MNMKLTRTILLLFFLTLSVAGLGAQEQSDSSAVVLSPADTLENSDSAGMFNALDYSMQSRYIERGEPFIENKFSDNTFLSVHGGSEKLSPRGNSTYNWSAAAKISFGKWFNPYNALRVTLAGERTVTFTACVRALFARRPQAKAAPSMPETQEQSEADRAISPAQPQQSA